MSISSVSRGKEFAQFSLSFPGLERHISFLKGRYRSPLASLLFLHSSYCRTANPRNTHTCLLHTSYTCNLLTFLQNHTHVFIPHTPKFIHYLRVFPGIHELTVFVGITGVTWPSAASGTWSARLPITLNIMAMIYSATTEVEASILGWCDCDRSLTSE